mgnify:CR=1 FL=1
MGIAGNAGAFRSPVSVAAMSSADGRTGGRIADRRHDDGQSVRSQETQSALSRTSPARVLRLATCSILPTRNLTRCSAISGLGRSRSLVHVLRESAAVLRGRRLCVREVPKRPLSGLAAANLLFELRRYIRCEVGERQEGQEDPDAQTVKRRHKLQARSGAIKRRLQTLKHLRNVGLSLKSEHPG